MRSLQKLLTFFSANIDYVFPYDHNTAEIYISLNNVVLTFEQLGRDVGVMVDG